MLFRSKGFLRRAQNEFGLRIKKIRSDNGTEFNNSQIEGFLEEEGIKHEFSSPYTPQQNGVVERKNRTLLDMARTMLDEYKTSDRFWAEAVNTACYAINRLYLHRILKKTSVLLPHRNPHGYAPSSILSQPIFPFQLGQSCDMVAVVGVAPFTSSGVI